MQYIIIVDSLVAGRHGMAWHGILKLKPHKCNESENISVYNRMTTATAATEPEAAMLLHLIHIELAKMLDA